MAAYQFVYHMSGVSKAYPGGKKLFENIHLNFLPGVKIGVVGVNRTKDLMHYRKEIGHEAVGGA